MPDHPQRIWLAAFLVAWSVDLLFWNAAPGISFVIFIALALLAAYLLAYGEKVRPAVFSLALSAMVLVMAGVTVLRAESFTRAINSMLSIAGVGLLALTFRSGDWTHYRLVDYIIGGIDLLISAISRGAGLRLAPKGDSSGGGRHALRKSLPVVRGLFLALPVVLVLGALLASADLVFANQLKDVFSIFNLEKLPEYLFRLTYVLVLAYGFAGLLLLALYPRPILHAVAPVSSAQVQPNETGENPAAEQPVVAPRSGGRFLGATEAFIVLGSVNLLFLFFVGVQFRYLFGGQSNITAAGFTYSEYARRGFFELVWVAVLSLLLYLLLSAITKREQPAQERTFTGLSVLLVALVGVILASAYQRLMLYENAYGFTSLRTYTHFFIPWLGLLLLGTIVLQLLRHDRYFNALLLVTAFGFSVTLGVLNIDAFIARQNLERARSHAELDGAYLNILSDDAVPVLAEAFIRPNQDPAVRDTLGVVLACRVYKNKHEQPTDWRSANYASGVSQKWLDSLDLSGYPVQQGDRGPFVQTKTGQEPFYCFGSASRD